MPPKSWDSVDGRYVNSKPFKNTISKLKSATAVIIEITTKPARHDPLLPFSLETLQSELSKRWGYTLKKTLDSAQTLYDTHELLTYPRVETQYLSLAHLSGDFDAYQGMIKNLPKLNQSPRAFDDQKLQGEANSAIIPTSQPAGHRVNTLTLAQRNIYHLVVQRYLLQFTRAHEREDTIVTTTVTAAGEAATYNFRSNGYTVTESGWVPIAATLDEAGFFSSTRKAKKTTAPKPYTEGTLGKDMRNIAKFVAHGPTRDILLKKEKAGIGTSATLASHIETLKKRGYVIEKGRALRLLVNN